MFAGRYSFNRHEKLVLGSLCDPMRNCIISHLVHIEASVILVSSLGILVVKTGGPCSVVLN
jgi:hypothetical protein